MLGLVEHKTLPVYPEEALAKGIQGDVIFKVEVDETGKLASAVPGEADPLLLAAAKDSLQTPASALTLSMECPSEWRAK
jgi:hypothetical protein